MNLGMSPQEVTALKQEILSSLHCAMPGIVESFDAPARTAAVRPALKRKGMVLPVIRDVPVFMPVSFTVNPGDACLLVFADFDIDAWLASGEAEEPVSGRMHALSDAFAFIGFRRGGQASESSSRG